ncbi:transcriptional regulator, LacI family [Abditibacterium utsteinense]|uniref:Transcriptional regulator, LacI family n=1 Tax=Abditibacterium utsteinense TaxID=1960156 RepID=A0A2S8SP85_9BACT|nr:LacI family DNA-binding transcriptional regulator [Abditibacterium utsteinense]PQV62607.1 transcriptional regulator, LacI family [Abditibacterium utsteinense]
MTITSLDTLEIGTRKNITMKDVALRAGVHLSSVSVVLNGSKSSAGISSQTRERITEAAAELGYRRNGSAHTIRTGRFGNVAILLSPLKSRSYLPLPLLAGLHDALDQVNMTLTFCMLGDERLTESGTLPKFLREHMCDGLLIDYNLRIPQPMIDSIRRHRIPAVWINSKQEADCVHPNDFEAAEQATQHLLQLGHRKIAYIDFANQPDDPHYSAYDRCRGHTFTMQQAGLEPQVWKTESAGSDLIDFCTERLVAQDRPTAVIGYATYAFEALSYAAARLGLNVPDDLSVVSFGPEQTDYMCQPMTMLIEPQYEAGHLATGMMLRKIENPNDLIAPEAVRFSLAIGKSSAPIPLKATNRVGGT